MGTGRPLTFGALLKRYRRAAGLTQEALAARAGYSPGYLSMLERGERVPTTATVELLAAALGVSAEESAAFLAAARRAVLVPSVEPDGRASTPRPPAPDATAGEDAPEAAASFTVPSRSAVLPTGTVTFLFTDIEGSTRLLQQLGSERYAALQAEHHRLVRAACAAHGGHDVDIRGDGFFVAFPTAPGAVAAAGQAQRALAAQPWPDGAPIQVRMGLHTGTPLVTPGGSSGDGAEGYVGLDVVRAARIAAAGHGGQVLLSAATRVLTEGALPDGITLRDLGEHRLKDLQQLERITQLVLPGLPADFPPLKSLDRSHHNLPIQPTVLLGREEAVAAVCALLRRDDVRLVTLTGPGGVGKTRLAVQVAAELVQAFADGTWFVSLSRLVAPALVLPTIAQTLGLQEAGSRPIQELLRDFVRTRQVLLLLDNFEQVVAAAPEVADLLQRSPALKVVVTSRIVLHLQGEREVPVAPLAVPSPSSPSMGRSALAEQLLEVPAVALFVERVRVYQPDFHLTEASAPAVAAICARLDGLPLAIGLAAARVKLLPPTQLLARLERRLPLLTGGARDLEARQQTMRNTLAWSEDLLTPEDDRLFRRLAVFVGGFTLEAAEAICAAPEGAEPLRLEVLEGLGTLADQSLVQQQTVGDDEGEEGSGEARFRLLYVVREYALERLEASDGSAKGQASQEAEALRRAHAVYYLGLAEERGFAAYGPEGAAWLGRLERDHDNFRAALAWAREHGEVEVGLRLAASLGPFWYTRGYFTEGRGWVEELLALAAQVAGAGDDGGAGALGVAGASAAARAKALGAACNFALRQGNDERAQEAAEEALALARGQQAGWAEGVALETLGAMAWDRGDLELATAYIEESVAQLRAVSEPWLAASYLTHVGLIALDRDDLERATTCCEESLAFARRTGADYVAGSALRGLAEVARRQGDLAGADMLGHEHVLVEWRLGAPEYLAGGLEGLARTAAAAAKEGARAERVARLLGAAAALRERVGAPQSPRRQAGIESEVAEARAALGEAGWAAAFAAGRALSLEEAIAEALDKTT
jgi:predicted ATPase/class 3 adenylate cyclase/DNA-binding XRE family transcriptional regulator